MQKEDIKVTKNFEEKNDTICPTCGKELKVEVLEMNDMNGMIYNMGTEYKCSSDYSARPKGRQVLKLVDIT